MTTIASTTPYAWPYDGLFSPARAAPLVVGSDGSPPPRPTVAPRIYGADDSAPGRTP